MYKIFPPLPFLSGAGCRGGEGEKYLNFPRWAINNSEQESVITRDPGHQLSSLQTSEIHNSYSSFNTFGCVAANGWPLVLASRRAALRRETLGDDTGPPQSG